MDRDHGELMSLLLERREMFEADEQFRAFVLESVRIFARDLRDLKIEISLKPETLRVGRSSGDWNSLKIGCE